METKSQKKALNKIQKLCEGGAPDRRVRRAVDRLRRRLLASANRQTAENPIGPEPVAESLPDVE